MHLERSETPERRDDGSISGIPVKKCLTCGRVHFYPRAICPFCGNDKTEWVTASGRGTVYSYSVMRRVPVPYALA